MPLFHEPVTRPLRLNCQPVEHTGLANGKVADVDHFLHFAFAFSDNFSRLERHELAELMFHPRSALPKRRTICRALAQVSRAISKTLPARVIALL